MSLALPGELTDDLFALLLAFASAVYVGFAVGGPEVGEVRLQWGVALAFTGVALLGVWLSPLFLAAGWLLHAAWDGLHHKGVLRTHATRWYPPLCLAYDVVVAAYIVGWWMWMRG